jgi:hypothetical protein
MRLSPPPCHEPPLFLMGSMWWSDLEWRLN